MSERPIPEDVLWAVHIQGPDDLIPVRDYLTAVRGANAFNGWWQQLKTDTPLHPYDPRMWAAPIEWTGSADAHAAALASPSPDYAGFIAMASTEARQ